MASQKKIFDPILVRPLELSRVRLDENLSEFQVCLTENILHCNHNIRIYRNTQNIGIYSADDKFCLRFFVSSKLIQYHWK